MLNMRWVLTALFGLDEQRLDARQQYCDTACLLDGYLRATDDNFCWHIVTYER